MRKQLAASSSPIRDAEPRLKTLTAQVAEAVATAGSRLPQVDGIGPVVDRPGSSDEGEARRPPDGDPGPVDNLLRSSRPWQHRTASRRPD